MAELHTVGRAVGFHCGLAPLVNGMSGITKPTSHIEKLTTLLSHTAAAGDKGDWAKGYIISAYWDNGGDGFSVGLPNLKATK